VDSGSASRRRGVFPRDDADVLSLDEPGSRLDAHAEALLQRMAAGGRYARVPDSAGSGNLPLDVIGLTG
jgi:hypothetical protein